MIKHAIGLIETIGLAAGIEAADAAVKSANVRLIGYELAKGDGMVTVKIEGDVGAVKAAIDSAKAAARKVGTVCSTDVIPRPVAGLEKIVLSPDTVGLKAIPVEKKAEIAVAPTHPKPAVYTAPDDMQGLLPSPASPADERGDTPDVPESPEKPKASGMSAKKKRRS